MSGTASTSTSVQETNSAANGARAMSVALIGPNESHRKVVAKALAGSSARTFTEFSDYPAKLTDLPQIVTQGFSVVMIDVDSDESYALQLIENFASFGSVIVMAYSQRNDPELLMNCMRAGAREFLPLPGQTPPLTQPVAQPDQAREPAAETPRPEPQQRPVPVAPVETRPDPVRVPTDGRPVNGPALVYSNTSKPLEAPSQVPASAPVQSAPTAEPEMLSPVFEAAEPQPDEPAKPRSDFDDWDSAHLRFTQLANEKAAEPRHRTATPRELFGRNVPKQVESVVPRPEPPSMTRTTEPERPPIPPEMLARGSRANPAEPSRVAPPVTMRSAEPVSAPVEDAPLPPEMFLRDPSRVSLSSSQPVDLFEQQPRKVYRPSPEEMTFSSLSTDADAAKSKGGGMIWAFLAAGAGMMGALAFLVFFMHPARTAPVTTSEQPQAPVVAQTPAAQTPLAPTPAAAPTQQAGQQQQPDYFDKEFSSATPGLRKPSPAQEQGAGGDGSDTPVSDPVSSNMMNQQLAAQSKLPSNIKKPASVEPPPPSGFNPSAIETGNSVPGEAFSSHKAQVVPVGAAVSAGVAEGMLIHRIPPVYPPIAKAAGVSGSVVLGATITKAGTISNLHVISGPKMLQEAAMQAVKSWRYRPYMLNNEPVSVDTTIKVVFDLGR